MENHSSVSENPDCQQNGRRTVPKVKLLLRALLATSAIGLGSTILSTNVQAASPVNPIVGLFDATIGVIVNPLFMHKHKPVVVKHQLAVKHVVVAKPVVDFVKPHKVAVKYIDPGCTSKIQKGHRLNSKRAALCDALGGGGGFTIVSAGPVSDPGGKDGDVPGGGPISYKPGSHVALSGTVGFSGTITVPGGQSVTVADKVSVGGNVHVPATTAPGHSSGFGFGSAMGLANSLGAGSALSSSFGNGNSLNESANSGVGAGSSGGSGNSIGAGLGIGAGVGISGSVD